MDNLAVGRTISTLRTRVDNRVVAPDEGIGGIISIGHVFSIAATSKNRADQRDTGSPRALFARRGDRVYYISSDVRFATCIFFLSRRVAAYILRSCVARIKRIPRFAFAKRRRDKPSICRRSSLERNDNYRRRDKNSVHKRGALHAKYTHPEMLSEKQPTPRRFDIAR